MRTCGRDKHGPKIEGVVNIVIGEIWKFFHIGTVQEKNPSGWNFLLTDAKQKE